MAKTPVKLKISDYKEREVQMYTYEFNREVKIDGQPSGIPRGGKITIKVKALNDGTPELLSWLLDQSLAKKGTLELSDNLSGKVAKTIEFEGAYCIDFNENWTEGVGHYETVTLSCQVLKIGGPEFKNTWD